MKRARGRTVGCEAADSINMAHVLMLLSQNRAESTSTNLVQYYPATEERVFECKTCKRQFPSFQALGGHRASHKKPRIGSEDCTDQQTSSAFAKPKLHECSICGLEFTIGQALGGHMRRHRQIGNEGFSVQHGILDINKSTCGESGDNGLFHVEMKMPLTDQGEMECKKDRELVTLNLFL